MALEAVWHCIASQSVKLCEKYFITRASTHRVAVLADETAFSGWLRFEDIAIVNGDTNRLGRNARRLLLQVRQYFGMQLS